MKEVQGNQQIRADRKTMVACSTSIHSIMNMYVEGCRDVIRTMPIYQMASMALRRLKESSRCRWKDDDALVSGDCSMDEVRGKLSLLLAENLIFRVSTKLD